MPSAGAAVFPIFADVTELFAADWVVDVTLDVIRHFFAEGFFTVVKVFENFTCFLLLLLFVDGLWLHFASLS